MLPSALSWACVLAYVIGSRSGRSLCWQIRKDQVCECANYRSLRTTNAKRQRSTGELLLRRSEQLAAKRGANSYGLRVGANCELPTRETTGIGLPLGCDCAAWFRATRMSESDHTITECDCRRRKEENLHTTGWKLILPRKGSESISRIPCHFAQIRSYRTSVK